MATKQSAQRVTREMTIEEIFTTFPHKGPRLAQELTNTGLHCVGCQASTWETVEAGMLGHGFAEPEIDALIQRLNKILEEEVDLTTITMTKKAADKYKQILADEGKQGWGLRLAVRAGGCSGFEYSLDYSQASKENDEIFSCHELEIHVSKAMVDKLLGCEVDYVEGLSGSGFKISNPNVKGSCGCGKSQSY